MRKSIFQIEALGERTFIGYTEGGSWNGWAVPFFAFAQAIAIAEAMISYSTAYYDGDADEFVFDDEEERFGSVQIDGLTLYGIGAGSWTWEEIDTHGH